MSSSNDYHHKKWYGNDHAQAVLKHFIGFFALGYSEAQAINHRVRYDKANLFCMIYQEHYVIVGGPNRETCLEVLVPVLREVGFRENPTLIEADMLVDCQSGLVAEYKLTSNRHLLDNVRKDGNG